MTRLARLTGKQLIRRLKRLGFRTICIKGSHHLLEHPDGRRTVVPVHRGETLGPGLMRKILRDTKLAKTDLD